MRSVRGTLLLEWRVEVSGWVDSMKKKEKKNEREGLLAK
jgi:hypothetical protein